MWTLVRTSTAAPRAATSHVYTTAFSLGSKAQLLQQLNRLVPRRWASSSDGKPVESTSKSADVASIKETLAAADSTSVTPAKVLSEQGAPVSLAKAEQAVADAPAKPSVGAAMAAAVADAAGLGAMKPVAEVITIDKQKVRVESGDPESGVLETTAANASQRTASGVLWFDSIYPIRRSRIDIRHYFTRHNHETLIPQLMIDRVKIAKMTLRRREGGVFVHFETEPGFWWTQQVTPEVVVEDIAKKLRDNPMRMSLSLFPISVHLVKGKPWLEDFFARYPSPKLRIELRGPVVGPTAVTEEQLYGQLRTFGRMHDLTIGAPVKDVPNLRMASVSFQRLPAAVGAKNCLHRIELGPATAPTVVYITYEPVMKASAVAELFSKHPRIMIPLLGILFAVITLLIFDPLREFFIKNRITGRFDTSRARKQAGNAITKLLTSLSGNRRWLDLVDQRRKGSGLMAPWSARQADEERVRKWLHTPPERILILTGPKGAGKASLVAKVVQGRKNVLKIDVSTMLDRSEDEFVNSLAKSVGFFPAFSFINTTSAIMDVFTPGASKATSSTKTSQVLKIFECVTNALDSIRRSMGARGLADPQALNAAASEGGDQAGGSSKQQQQQKDKASSGSSTGSGAAAAVAAVTVVAVAHPLRDQLTAPPATSTASTTASSESAGSSPDGAQKIAEKRDVLGLRGVVRSVTGVAEKVTDAAGKITDKTMEVSKTIGSSVVHGAADVVSGAVDAVSTAGGAVATAATKTASAVLGDHKEGKREQEEPEAPVGPRGAMVPSKVWGSEEYHDDIPLFIIEGFNADNRDKQDKFLYHLVQWASDVTDRGLARVLFMTDAFGVLEEGLARTLPDVKLDSVVLNDADLKSAVQFVSASVGAAAVTKDTADAVAILGGRYSDLFHLVRVMQTGVSPAEAVEDIVDDAVRSVRNMVFAPVDPKNPPAFTKVQFWNVVLMFVHARNDMARKAREDKAKKTGDASASAVVAEDAPRSLLTPASTGSTASIAEAKLSAPIPADPATLEELETPPVELVYDDVLFNVFKGDNNALRSLMRADVLRLVQQVGQTDRLRAGSPVLLEAFRRLASDPKFRPGMDLMVVKANIDIEMNKLAAFEDELSKLENMASASSGRRRDRSDAVNFRREFLLTGINEQHVKLAALDAERRRCESLLKKKPT